VNIDSIIENGLVPPGAVVKTADGKTQKINIKNGDAGTKGVKSIFVSPSIDYASHSLYTKPVQVTEPGAEPGKDKVAWLYFVLQVRVKPGCFKIQGNTLWAGGWKDKKIPYDSRFGPHELEWVIEGTKSDCVRVTGIMVQKRYIDKTEDVEKRFLAHQQKYLARQAEKPGDWFWNCGPKKTLSPEGPWQAYDKAQNDLLEAAWKNGQSMIFVGDIKVQGEKQYRYYVDFVELEQRRTDNNMLKRKVKREPQG